MATAATPATEQTVKLFALAVVESGDGPRHHYIMVEASADTAGRWTVRTEQNGNTPTTVSGDGERPELVLADGAVRVRFPA